MNPKEYFENAPPVKGGNCFVVMPFRAPFSGEVFLGIKSGLKAVGMECYRADRDVHGGMVMSDVLHGLAEAELVIVDLTGNNPNVLYELGLAHAARCEESVLLITQDIKEVPFDVKHLRILEYGLGDAGLNKMLKRIADMVTEEILPSRFVYRWSEAKPNQMSNKFPGEDKKLYSFNICDVNSGQGAAEFRLVVFRHTYGFPNEEVYNQMQPLLKREEMVEIPKLSSWAIKLDHATSDEAVFCACRLDTKSAKPNN